MPPTDDRLSPAEAARKLNCTPQYIKKLYERGDLTGTRTSLGRLIDPASVDRLAAERAAKARRQRETVQ